MTEQARARRTNCVHCQHPVNFTVRVNGFWYHACTSCAGPLCVRLNRARSAFDEAMDVDESRFVRLPPADEWERGMRSDEKNLRSDCRDRPRRKLY